MASQEPGSLMKHSLTCERKQVPVLVVKQPQMVICQKYNTMASNGLSHRLLRRGGRKDWGRHLLSQIQDPLLWQAPSND